MQEITTIRKRIELPQRSLRVASMLLAIAALTGCDEQPSPATSTTKVVNDSAALYAALSATLEQCDEAYEACLDAAGENSRAQIQCESGLETCSARAQSQENECEQALDREAHHCHSICGDEDAGVDDADAGSGDMNQCITRHAPRLPKCLSGLVTCLDEAGICSHDLSRGEFRDCVHEAHHCIKDELRALREKKHKWWRHHRAGSNAAGSGGAGAGGTAGAAVAGSGGATVAGSGGDPGTAGSGGMSGAGGTPVSPNDIDPAQAGSGGSCDDGSGAEAGGGGAGGSDDGRGERRRHPWFPFSRH